MKSASLAELISRIPILNVLDSRDKSQLLAIAELRDIPKFSPIYSPGSSTDKIFFLLRGMVKIAIHSDQGREAIKFIIDGPRMFGEQGLTGASYRDDFAVTMIDGAQVLEIEVSDFKTMMLKNHLLAKDVITFLGNKVREIEKRLESQVFKNARDRIVDFIRESACKRGKKVGYDWFLKRNLTQQEIANYTGTSRQTVTEVFNELKKANQISFNRHKILIRDSFEITCK